MKLLFDTSSLIELERNNELALRAMKKHLEDDLYISVVSVSEFHIGALLTQKPKAAQASQAFLSQFLWEDITASIALKTAEIVANQKKKGRRIHFQDASIAATAEVLAVDVLVTENIKDFLYVSQKIKTLQELIS